MTDSDDFATSTGSTQLLGALRGGVRDAATIPRRTLVQGAAWAVPAIAFVAAAPAYATSGNALTFRKVPADTPACSPTQEDIVVRLDGPSNVGALVQLSLSAGWSWASGSGSYSTDTNGEVTVPAGQIIAGPKAGIIAATAGSGPTAVTAATDLSVVSGSPVGYFGFGAVDTSVPAAVNSGFVRLYTNWNSALGVKTNGELWLCYNSGAWTQVASGVDTGAYQAAFIVNPDVQKALWTSNGVLYLDGSAAVLPSGSNVGFVRVAAGAGIAVAAKANGEVWKWSTADGWSLLGVGGESGPGQIACLTAASESAIWIKGGVIYSDSAPADLNATDNHGFLYVCSGRGINLSDSGLGAVKANSEVWQRKGAVWSYIGTGADLGPGKIGFLFGSGPVGTDGGVWWIKSGVLMNEMWPEGPPAGQNHDIVRIVDNGPVNVTIRRDGQAFRYYYGWDKLSTDVPTGLNQVARAFNSTTIASRTPIYYLVNAATC